MIVQKQPSCTQQLRHVVSDGRQRTLRQLVQALGGRWPQAEVNSALMKLAVAGELVVQEVDSPLARGRRRVKAYRLAPVRQETGQECAR